LAIIQGKDFNTMARTLLLLRHAKSSWSDATLADFERPLNKRGQKAAPRMGAYLRKQGLMPELVLCSAARRAVETWALAGGALAKSGTAPAPPKHLRSLYLAPPSRILAALRRTPDEVERLLVVGHNPGLEHLALGLAGSGSKPKAHSRLKAKFPTAALAELHFEARNWREVAPGTGRLVRFVTPREL
jgi:phosphohistidine phosphatase